MFGLNIVSIYIYRMYRLTISGPIADKYIDTHLKNDTQKQIHKIYRWGDKWGELCASNQWEHNWKAESRKDIAHHIDNQNLLLLESIEPMHSCQSPPIHIDDSWEEEVVVKNNIVFGTTLVIIGTGSSLQSTCSSLSMPYMNWLQSNTQITENVYVSEKSKPKPIQKPTQKPAQNSFLQTSKQHRPICLITTD